MRRAAAAVGRRQTPRQRVGAVVCCSNGASVDGAEVWWASSALRRCSARQGNEGVGSIATASSAPSAGWCLA